MRQQAGRQAGRSLKEKTRKRTTLMLALTSHRNRRCQGIHVREDGGRREGWVQQLPRDAAPSLPPRFLPP